MIPEKVRVSAGTAALLRLDEYWLDVKPTTAYLMTYTEGSCLANCAFCPQARKSPSDKSLLSRVLWPAYATLEVLEGLRKAEASLQRVCIQTVNYQGFFDDALALLRKIKEVSETPVSIDTAPLTRAQMEELKRAGLDRIGIPLDSATEELFDQVKGEHVGGPYRWEKHLAALDAAVEVFGPGRVLSNLIVGLGEAEKEAVELIQRLMDMGVETGLFAFTPIPGTALSKRPQPTLDSYRRIQLARHIITRGLARIHGMEFDDEGRITGFGVDEETMASILETGECFKTSGCPGCNRPYYNERPSGPFYNYPRCLTAEEAQKEAKMLGWEHSKQSLEASTS
jgi:biotin synthase-related radical SAM superfamily protein